MTTSRIAFAAWLLALAAAAPGRAQVVTGAIEGRVVTEDGAALADAAVTVRAPGFRQRTVATDARGQFRLLALPPDNYDVEIAFIGRETLRVSGQRVHIGQTTGLGTLVSSARAIALEGLVAAAARPPLDVTTAELGTLVTREQFEHLPMERDYHVVAALLPHVSNSVYGDGLNFAGATGLENLYYVDGANTTEPVGGSEGLWLPYNFIKEIEIRTGGYEAEYRGALGGTLNVVTQSGTNDLRGEAFAFYAGKRFGPEPRQNIREVSRGDYSLYDVGASLGGPIRRDRMWFFLAWNPAFESEDVPLPGQGMFDDHSVSHRFAAKVTWQPTERTRVELNGLGNPTVKSAVGATAWGYGPAPTQMPAPDPLLSTLKTGATTFSGRVTHFLSPTLLLEASAQHSSWLSRWHARDGVSSEPLYIDAVSMPGEVIWAGGFPDDSDLDIGRTAAQLHLTATRGAHELEVGADLERHYAGGRDMHGRVRHLEEDSWNLLRYSLDGDPVANRSIGVFAQDSWAVTDRLRLNVGLRWGAERIFASDGTLAARLDDEWQPRLGAVFQPGEPGRHKLSASWGRFYQQVPINAPQALYTVGARWESFDYDHDPRIDSSGGVGSDDITERVEGVVDLKGLYFDEWTLGYERLFGATTKAGVRLLRRDLGMALEDGAYYDWNFRFGNPGYGDLDYLPRAERSYTALELSVEHALSRQLFVLGSYVLSRTHGNYPGFFATDFGYAGPNYNSGFDQPDMLSSGLLPNDRPHVFKASAWYRPERMPVTVGASFLWQSGTPRSEFGGTRVGPPFFGFVRPRGTAGRTPAVRDLNLRAAYRLPGFASNATLLLDLFHVGGARTPLTYDQQHYQELDEAGNQVAENPDYGRVTSWQAKMAGRIGLQVAF